MERIEFQLNIYRSALDELSGPEQEMLVTAREKARTAYAPYSKFGVGAAILFDDGSIISANNQENAAYPSGLCAERVALFMAGSNYPGKKIKKILIVVDAAFKEKDRIYAPCGGCRQVMSEYEHKQDEAFEVLFEGPEGFITRALSVKDLLPFTFELKP